MSALEFLRAELAQWESDGLGRRLRLVDSAQGREITIHGRRALNFCSNNYLALADHPALSHAAAAALREWGLGAGASRLIVGNQRIHEQVESELAELLAAEAALLFNSGYHANLGVIPALLSRQDVVFSDELNHASLIDGCRLSRAQVVVYRHCDMDDLSRRMTQHRGRRRLIVTDAVFSMDGDRAPLGSLSTLANEHGAVLMVDEAHSVGIFGDRGQGLCTELGVHPHIRMATLGKSLGGFGAFVAGCNSLREYLVNRSRTFVFTTALPSVVVAAAGAAARLIRGQEGAERRARLHARIDQFAQGLHTLGMLEPGAGTTPIFPVVIGDNDRTMECCERLLEAGIYVQGIRPPTVPVDTSRLRFALMADHTEEDVDRVLDALHTTK